MLRKVLNGLGVDTGVADRAWLDQRYEQRLQSYALTARKLEVDATPTFYFNTRPLRGLQAVETLFATAREAGEKRQP